jgi:MFS family permease
MALPRDASPRLVALQHRDFRLFWLALLSTTVGLQMQTIAVNWQVYTLLRDSAPTLTFLGRTVDLNAGALGLGMLGLARWAPLLLFALAGGLLADTRNRRKLLMATQVAAALLALLLALLTYGGQITVLSIYGVVAALAALSAIEYPAREALVSNLVPRNHLTNAVSLMMMTNVIGAIAGPALGGFILERGQIDVIYLLHALSYLPALAALGMIRHTSQVGYGVGITRHDLLEGFRFTFRTHMIRSTMLVDFFATLLGSARTLLPIVADQVLGVGAGGYGLLATAQPLGSLLAASLASIRRDIHRQGLIFLICILAYGLGTALFGLSTVFLLSYGLFAITGAADTTSSIIRGAIRQLWTPDALRGRMVGVNMIFYMGGPQLGEVRAGLVATLVGAPAAIISGGLMAALVALWAGWRDPVLRQYTGEVGEALADTRAVADEAF